MDKELLRKKIEFLVELYYGKFDFLRKESLDVLKKKALDKYLDSGLTMEEIQEKLEKEILERKKLENKSMGNDSDEMAINKNHHSIYETLEELAYLLRMANVNYYIEGGLAAYLRYDEESNRIHDNINITVEKKDFDKLKSMCDILGISVVDKGVDVLNSDDSKADIVMSSFERLEDGAIKKIDYDDDGNEVETILNPKLAGIVYGNEKVDFKGYSLSVLPAEYLFFIKDKSDNSKDKIDANFLRNKIDSKGLKIIQDYSNFEYKPDELSSMMNDNIKDHDIDPKNKELSTAKQKVLEKQNDNGYATTGTISGMSILAIAIMIICILIVIMRLR